MVDPTEDIDCACSLHAGCVSSGLLPTLWAHFQWRDGWGANTIQPVHWIHLINAFLSLPSSLIEMGDSASHNMWTTCLSESLWHSSICMVRLERWNRIAPKPFKLTSLQTKITGSCQLIRSLAEWVQSQTLRRTCGAWGLFRRYEQPT